MARDEALAHDRPRSLRWVLAFGACGCLIVLAALALALLSSGDAHAVELGPLEFPVEMPGPTPADSLVGTVDPTPSAPAPADPQPLDSVVEPVLGTVVEPVVEPVVDPMLGTVEPVVEPVVEPELDTITPADEQPIPVLPSSELLAPVPGGVDGVQPFATPQQTSLAMPPRPPRAFADLAPAVSADIAADVPVGSSSAPVDPSNPSPANRGSPILPQAMRPSTSTSNSTDTGHGLQLLLYVIATALAAFCLPRGRRVLPFRTVMPRFALVSPIERPG